MQYLSQFGSTLGTAATTLGKGIGTAASAVGSGVMDLGKGYLSGYGGQFLSPKGGQSEGSPIFKMGQMLGQRGNESPMWKKKEEPQFTAEEIQMVLEWLKKKGGR